MNTMLIIAENQAFLQHAKELLHRGGHNNMQIGVDPGQAMMQVDRGAPFDVVLIDLDMQGLNGLQLIDLIYDNAPYTESIVVSSINDAQFAVECLKRGASDYLVKPVTDDQLIASVNRALIRFESARACAPTSCTADESTGGTAFDLIVTCSGKMRRILHEAWLHAASNVPILITGESGTGKELLARAIHKASGRNNASFTPINMSSLAGSLFDAEFFGHTRGAFTGAERARIGYLEHSDGGTLFLDEVGDLPVALQGKLLRVLEQGEFMRLGASTAQKVDLRFISATNTDINRMLVQKAFRQDLYYRLNGVRLHLPPLRERREDIPLLADHFISEFRTGRTICRIDGEAMKALAGYDYPGNVRELKAVIQSALNLAEDHCLTLRSLPAYVRKYGRKRSVGSNLPSSNIIPLSEIERRHVIYTYKLCDGNKMQAAKTLGIGITTLRNKLSSYGIG